MNTRVHTTCLVQVVPILTDFLKRLHINLYFPTPCILTLIIVASFILASVSPVSAQENALHYLELDKIGATPADILLSPDYQTIIEFEGMTVDSASSGRADQITVELDEQIIRLRANQDAVNTDLTVDVGGKTALFTLHSDPATKAPRRYVVRNPPPPTLLSLSSQNTEGKGNLDELSVGTRDLPPGVKLDLEAARSGNGEIVIRYTLSNDGKNAIVNDSYRLNILNEDTKLLYTLSRVPPAGSVNVIQPGQSEYGTIVVPTPPNGTINFLWILVERGPGGHYAVARDISALINTGQQITPRTPLPGTSQTATAQPATTETQAVETALQTVEPQQTEPSTNEAVMTAPAKVRQPGENLVLNGAFDKPGSSVWMALFANGANGVTSTAEGMYCLDVFKSGETPWSIGLSQSDLALESSHSYTLQFDAYTDTPQDITTKLGSSDTKMSFAEQTFELGTDAQTFSLSFDMSATEPNGNLEFLAGAEAAETPYRICVDNIWLSETTSASKP
jgi:hypothetical protein